MEVKSVRTQTERDLSKGIVDLATDLQQAQADGQSGHEARDQDLPHPNDERHGCRSARNHPWVIRLYLVYVALRQNLRFLIKLRNFCSIFLGQVWSLDLSSYFENLSNARAWLCCIGYDIGPSRRPEDEGVCLH